MLLHLFLTLDEIKACNTRKQLCWEANDQIKWKEELDQECEKLIQERQKFPTLPDLVTELYKSLISYIVNVIQQFSLCASLPDVSFEIQNEDNSIWIHIPQRSLIISDLEHKTQPSNKRGKNTVDSMLFEIFKTPDLEWTLNRTYFFQQSPFLK